MKNAYNLAEVLAASAKNVADSLLKEGYLEVREAVQEMLSFINDIYTGEFNGMISGTAWGAFNALTERLDWHRNARGDNNESLLAAASGFDATITAEKNRLLKVVKDVLAIA